MTNVIQKKDRCIIPECDGQQKGRGLCQRHYDVWYGKIRRERDKLRNREQPFQKITNPYRAGTGYHIIFEEIRSRRPMTREQIARHAKAALARVGKPKYRVDYALEVLKAVRHASKRGKYQVRIDSQGRWHLIQER